MSNGRIKFSLVDLRECCQKTTGHIFDLLGNWDKYKSSGDLKPHLDLIASRCEWLIRMASDSLIEVSKTTATMKDGGAK